MARREKENHRGISKDASRYNSCENEERTCTFHERYSKRNGYSERKEDGQAQSTEKRKPFFIIAFQRSFEKDKWRNREYGNRKRVIL